ncbi:hypothetical protein [Nocardia sp. NPDC060249]|uniref:hypothetical protein n=1 Tax=Nocardia sp. NPDC060249 TaxID=3347082 RepID=UPI0036623D31
MSDMDDVISPYQARLYNAVIFGERHGRRHATNELASLLRRVWKSRRFWQARAIADAKTIDLVGALCEAEQRRAGIVNAFVRTDHILYALYPDGPPPQGWDQVRFVAERILRDAA